MKKGMIRYFIILGIAVLIYSLLVFVIPYPHFDEATFVLAYIGGLVALLAQGYTVYLAFGKNSDKKSMLYGMPIVKVGVVYLIAQLVVTLLILVINAFVAVPAWIIILLDIVLLGLAAIGVITTEGYREEVEKIENEIPLSTKFINDLKVDTKLLADRYASTSMGKLLSVLADEVRFSDPKSSDALVEIEDEIERKFIELKEVLLKEDYVLAKTLAEHLLELVKERNVRCKLNKK